MAQTGSEAWVKAAVAGGGRGRLPRVGGVLALAALVLTTGAVAAQDTADGYVRLCVGETGSVTAPTVTGECVGGRTLAVVPKKATFEAAVAGGTWRLIGNAGTTPGTHFLGTTDDEPLELKVNGQRALRLEPTADTPNVIGGHTENSVAGGLNGATIGGGGTPQNPNRVIPSTGFPPANFATVGGGAGNTASGLHATVGGGFRNTVGGHHATIGGGADNTAGDLAATVGGGSGNTASVDFATVGGGSGNTASRNLATVGGGFDNTASGNGATVGGGGFNEASGPSATVGGGSQNTASGIRATVSGGSTNTASGLGATVPGGDSNQADGDYSLAAGRRAKVHADHDGAVLFADSAFADFHSAAANEFAARASGGVRFVVGTTTCTLTSGASDWNCSSTSDRAAKDDFAAVDGREVLARLQALPISSWSYTDQDSPTRHLGPTAQDFRAAFGLGSSDARIDAVDAQGVALAAIQGLGQIVQEQDAELTSLHQTMQDQDTRLAEKDTEIAGLREQNAAQQGRLESLEARLAAIEARLGAGDTR